MKPPALGKTKRSPPSILAVGNVIDADLTWSLSVIAADLEPVDAPDYGQSLIQGKVSLTTPSTMLQAYYGVTKEQLASLGEIIL
jgi:hypothetical protein